MHETVTLSKDVGKFVYHSSGAVGKITSRVCKSPYNVEVKIGIPGGIYKLNETLIWEKEKRQ